MVFFVYMYRKMKQIELEKDLDMDWGVDISAMAPTNVISSQNVGQSILPPPLPQHLKNGGFNEVEGNALPSSQNTVLTNHRLEGIISNMHLNSTNIQTEESSQSVEILYDVYEDNRATIDEEPDILVQNVETKGQN